jgi:hypothetical protein
VQVLSATPESEPEAPALASGPLLLGAPAGSVERTLLQLKVLKDRKHDLEAKGADNALRAVAEQVSELEAEIEALQRHADLR